MLFFNNLRDGVNCIYNTRDTSGVQHMYTMHPAGPLGQVTDTIAQRAKVLSDIQSHRVQVELIFTHLSTVSSFNLYPSIYLPTHLPTYLSLHIYRYRYIRVQMQRETHT